jgi:hypothetical protein
VVETSEWFEERSAAEDAARIQRHLDKLIEAMIVAAARRRGASAKDVVSVIRTVPDPDHPGDEPVNSL